MSITLETQSKIYIAGLESRIAQLETKLAEANDYIDKINTIYQNEEIFVVKNGEGFYTDKFDSVIMTNIVAIQEQRK